MREFEEAGRTAAETAEAPNQQPDTEVDVASTNSKRSPAFQFYPRDFLSSRKVDRMSMAERGIYITLLAHCWIDRGLPTDVAELAATCRMKPEPFQRIWTSGVLQHCFEARGGRLVNPRLELERRVQAEYSRKQKEKADKRWGVNAGAMPHSDNGSAPIPSHPIPSHPIPKERKDSAEPHSDSTPVVLTFPVVGNPNAPEWALTPSQLDAWAQAYPDMDVAAACHQAKVWVEADRTRRKTAGGMPRFLVGWFNRAVNSGRSNGSSTPGMKTAGNVEALQRFANRGRV